MVSSHSRQRGRTRCKYVAPQQSSRRALRTGWGCDHHIRVHTGTQTDTHAHPDKNAHTVHANVHAITPNTHEAHPEM